MCGSKCLATDTLVTYLHVLSIVSCTAVCILVILLCLKITFARLNGSLDITDSFH